MVSFTLRCAWTQFCTQNWSAWTSCTKDQLAQLYLQLLPETSFVQLTGLAWNILCCMSLGTACLGSHSSTQELVGEIVRLIGKSKGIKTSIQFLMRLFFPRWFQRGGKWNVRDTTNKHELKCVYSRVPRIFSFSMTSLWRRRSLNIELCYISQSS